MPSLVTVRWIRKKPSRWIMAALLAAAIALSFTQGAAENVDAGLPVTPVTQTESPRQTLQSWLNLTSEAYKQVTAR